jgi:hypothetical protein
MSEKRVFTVSAVSSSNKKIVASQSLGGRFVSSSPMQAAMKASSRICRDSGIKGACTSIVEVQEVGGKGKTYRYEVKRVNDPVTVEYGNGVEITRQFSVSARSLN